jgi:hypothetical protein
LPGCINHRRAKRGKPAVAAGDGVVFAGDLGERRSIKQIDAFVIGAAAGGVPQVGVKRDVAVAGKHDSFGDVCRIVELVESAATLRQQVVFAHDLQEPAGLSPPIDSGIVGRGQGRVAQESEERDLAGVVEGGPE